MRPDQFGFISMRAVFGVAIILIGLLSLIANLGYDIDVRVWDYWPVILILLGLSMITQPRGHRGGFAGSLFIIVGLLFLLDNLEIIDFGYRIIWPIIIISVGAAILRHGLGAPGSSAIDTETIDITAILGGGDYNYASSSMKGGRVFALMGGAKIDLREANFSGDSMVIDIFTLMGGVEILVPKRWQVNVQGVPILGGIDNKTESPKPVDTQGTAASTGIKHLIVKGTAVMGGIEVKN
jgi:predicted membrane protein